MLFRLFGFGIAACALLLILTAPVLAADKSQARIEKVSDLQVSNMQVQDIRVRPSLSTADSCYARMDDSLAWLISNWVIGQELYKNYIDPAYSCEGPYPYTIAEINMPMYFTASTQLIVSVDVESADLTNPSCPVPGYALSVSSSWELTVPGEGLYNIFIPLDTPVVVNEPFFAGFYIANVIDTLAGAALLTDDNGSTICASYNIWDTTLGFVDLNNNDYYDFPGRLVLYVSGSPGGSGGTQPEPEISILSPTANQKLFGSAEIWAGELSGSEIIDYVAFEYSDGGDFIEVSRDYDGISPLRDDMNDSGVGNGFTFDWDFSLLAEGTYTVRVIAVDTLGRSDTDQVAVYLEPTPPVPSISSFVNGDPFCTDLNLLLSISDENVNSMSGYIKVADSSFSLGINALSSAPYGNGYSSAVAGALVIQYWANNGFSFLMREGFETLSLDTLVARLGQNFFALDENAGAFDEAVFSGMLDYNIAHGNALVYEYTRNIDYHTLRSWVEEEEKPVMLGLGGVPGFWVVVDGFDGWQQGDFSWNVRISNPLTGSLETVSMRNEAGDNQVYIDGVWHNIDIAISTTVVTWNPTRSLIGSDNNSADGWEILYQPSDTLTGGFNYFVRVEAIDANALSGDQTVLLSYDCSAVFVPGDYDNDGSATIADLSYLMNYFLNEGPEPVGGVWRADVNCDNHINITDIIYYVNFIFGLVSPPCH